VRVRIILGALLLVAGIAVPVVAVAMHGVPWGFRGAPAVVLEATGDVEVTPGPARVVAPGAPATLAATPGMRLLAGDGVRVGRFSEARLRFAGADVALKDGARATLGDQHLTVGRGLVEIVVKEGTRGERIDVEGVEPGKPDAQVTVQPGRALISCDGKGTCIVVVKEGSAQATTAVGGESAEPAQSLLLARGSLPVVKPAPTKVELTAECHAQTKAVVGTAAAATQVFLDGKMDYADGAGKFSLPWPPGASLAILFARDPAGNVDRKLVVCAGG
jgi:hypothetical protein